MPSAFAAELFWKSLRDYRAWIGAVGLALAAVGGATGKSIILPSWDWIFIAFCAALSIAIRAEWKAYQADKAKIDGSPKGKTDFWKNPASNGENDRVGSSPVRYFERGRYIATP